MNYDELRASGKIDHFHRMAFKKIGLLISMKGDRFLGFGDVTNDYVCMSFTDDKCYVSMFGRVTWL